MKTITAQELRQNKDQFKLVDVREPYEHEEFNIGGLNIPLGEISHRLNELIDDQDPHMVIYCRSGARSRMACELLSAQGFNDVYNLEGGIMEW